MWHWFWRYSAGVGPTKRTVFSSCRRLSALAISSFGRPVITFRAADPELLAEPPPWQEWQYPDSRVHNSSTGSGGKLGDIEFGSADRVALTTADDFDKVWAFYKDKCKLSDPGDSSTSNVTRPFA